MGIKGVYFWAGLLISATILLWQYCSEVRISISLALYAVILELTGLKRLLDEPTGELTSFLSERFLLGNLRVQLFPPRVNTRIPLPYPSMPGRHLFQELMLLKLLITLPETGLIRSWLLVGSDFMGLAAKWISPGPGSFGGGTRRSIGPVATYATIRSHSQKGHEVSRGCSDTYTPQMTTHPDIHLRCSTARAFSF